MKKDKQVTRDALVQRVIDFSMRRLGYGSSYTSPSVPCRLGKSGRGSYFVVVSLLDRESLLFQEMVKSLDGVGRLFRSWTFHRHTVWEAVNVERNGKQIFLQDLLPELQDLDVKLDALYKAITPSGFYYAEEIPASGTDLFVDLEGNESILRTLSRSHRTRILSHAAFAVGIILLLGVTFFSSVRLTSLSKVKQEIDDTITRYQMESEEQFDDIQTFISNADLDLQVLKDTLANTERDFEFSRRQAYINVLRLAEELTYRLPARKEAYRLIAANILEAASYGEIIYEMSKLPSEEYQARILLATSEEKITPFSLYEPVFTDMVYPVRIPGKANDGKGFRITSGFMDKRIDPLGSGGYQPHYAVDIMNVANISLINYAGEIIRDGNPAGDVVAVADGTVTQTGFDERYGWFVEIEHEINDSVRKAYPRATFWRTFYSHLVEKPSFAFGDKVAVNQKLGDIGSTGASTGPHLHFEVRVMRPGGKYYSSTGHFDKINPFPRKRPSVPRNMTP
jgi:murein DD-endopeptidase MepM/ murein hydrolase activator NlpD